jgi:hypothetical protein
LDPGLGRSDEHDAAKRARRNHSYETRGQGVLASRHLKVLEQAKLIRREVEAQKRRCYLRPETLKEASEWMETYRRFWTERLDKMETYLATLASLAPASKEEQSDE